MRGFRPGKVPVAHLKKLYGRSVMAETIEAVIREINAKIVEERGLRLAMEPKVTLPEEETEVEKVIGGEVRSRLYGRARGAAQDRARRFQGHHARAAGGRGRPTPRSRRRWARSPSRTGPSRRRARAPRSRSGDRVVIDFTGKLDGQPFEGGTGGDIGVNVGSNTFIPGFEDQLIGMAAGETRLVKVTFPANYTNAELAGKDAEFDVTAKSVEAPGDGHGRRRVREIARHGIARQAQGGGQGPHRSRSTPAASRQKLKRKLLDQLDAMHQFALPPTLAEEEFKNVWTAVESDLKSQNRTFADEGTTEEKAREEYRTIAERRVRLGLVLAEIGEKNNITVTDDELSRAIVERARQFPGREQEIWEYYRKNPAGGGERARAAVRGEGGRISWSSSPR